MPDAEIQTANYATTMYNNCQQVTNAERCEIVTPVSHIEENLPDLTAKQAKRIDGGEPTPPSQGGELIARPEPFSPKKDINRPAGVSNNTTRDIFDDLAALGRSIDELTPSEKVLTVLSIRKPKKDEWFRCHGEIHAAVNIYESANKEFYLVLPAALEALDQVVRPVRLRMSVTYSGETFVWPVAVPSLRKPYPCHVTAATAADKAIDHWTRIAWTGNDYEVYRRAHNGKEPQWPAEITTASEMLRFVSKTGGFEVVDTAEHPVVRELLGLA